MSKDDEIMSKATLEQLEKIIEEKIFYKVLVMINECKSLDELKEKIITLLKK